MINNTILLRIEPDTKEKLRQLADKERRSMTSYILSLIDKKINEADKDAGQN